VAPEVVALRLGRLGDLVMVEPALRWLVASGVSVTLVTSAHYVGTFDRLLADVHVVPPAGMPDRGLVLDLHRVAGSRRLRRGRDWIGVGKEDLRRRLRVLAPCLGLRPRLDWPGRHLQAASRALEALGLSESPMPAPLPRLPADAAPEQGTLGISPGAGHAAKQWPVVRWRELVQRWPGRVLVFGSPDEAELVAAVGGEAWPDPSLAGLVEGLSRCEAVVAGDTGPLHLAGALGRRVVGLFGPTPVDTGFWVWGDRGEAIVPLARPCAPCSLHGRDRCPRRHHACLAELTADRVLEALA
jgi:hypothetical protein